jgi:hypothetical protein
VADVSALHLIGYIDAGTGSYLLAAVASGAAGLWMFFRSGLMKLRRRVRGEASQAGPSSEAPLIDSEPEEPVTRG